MRINWPADRGRPFVVAHRGVSAQYPENTHAAFEAAVQTGADGIEFDIQVTADNQLVVVHDQTLERYGHPDVNVATANLDQLRSLDMGSWYADEFRQQRIPLLSDVLNDYGNLLTLCVELKPHDLLPERITQFLKTFVRTIEAQGMESAICVLCFDIDVLEQLYSLAPWARLVWNTHHPEKLVESDFGSRPWLSGIDGRIGRITVDVVKDAHQCNLTALSFTCNTPEEITKARACNVDVLIGNDPEQVRRVLETNTVCEYEA